jgi:orotate phosphoribosyltransferase
MTPLSAKAFLELVRARRGHFRLESGHHARLWLDLDSLFAEPARIMTFVTSLADRVRAYEVSAVCGPLVGGAFLAQLVAQALEVEFWFTERVVPEARDGLYGVRYVLAPSLAKRARDQRVAMVDDVMSAGSALRGTFAELRSHGAKPVVAGALLVLGSAGDSYFAAQRVPVEAVTRSEYELWLPSECPLCTAGMPLEDVVASGEQPAASAAATRSLAHRAPST